MVRKCVMDGVFTNKFINRYDGLVFGERFHVYSSSCYIKSLEEERQK